MGNVCQTSLRPGGLYLTERALGLCIFAAGDRVLDVGCGVGETVELMMDRYGLDAVGIDPLRERLDQGCQRRPGLPLLSGSGEMLPFADGEMDGVFAECTLSVMSEPEKALAEFHRVLKEGGHLVISDLYLRDLAWIGSLRESSLRGHWPAAAAQDEIVELLSSSGFLVTDWEDHSELLKQYVFQMIMTEGSLDQCLPLVGYGDMTPEEVTLIRKSRPGYFLLIARKS